jgi:hypothetical protein
MESCGASAASACQLQRRARNGHPRLSNAAPLCRVSELRVTELLGDLCEDMAKYTWALHIPPIEEGVTTQQTEWRWQLTSALDNALPRAPHGLAHYTNKRIVCRSAQQHKEQQGACAAMSLVHRMRRQRAWPHLSYPSGLSTVSLPVK